MKQSLYSSIQEVQQNKSDDVILFLLEKFRPLLKKCVNSVHSSLYDKDEIYNEFQTFFVELIITLPLNDLHDNSDSTLLSYIHKSMKNHMYVIYEKNSLKKNELFYDDIQINDFQSVFYSMDSILDFKIRDLKAILTDKEYDVVFKIFVNDLTVSEIANIKHISRQAINRTKLSAFRKIKKWYNGTK